MFFDFLSRKLPEMCRNSCRLERGSHGFVSLERRICAKSSDPKRGSFELKAKSKKT